MRIFWTPIDSNRSSVCPTEGQTASIQHGVYKVPLKYLWCAPPRKTRTCALKEEVELNRIWVPLCFGLRWGPTYTRPVNPCGSDLEDTLMRSAGRCSPLVTLTISPTATFTSQFKIIKMGGGGQITEKIKTKQMDKRDRRFEIIIEKISC